MIIRGDIEAHRRAGDRQIAALAILVTCFFVINLDTAIIEVALPSIQREMALSLSDVSWIANAYVLTFGGLLLLGGRLGDLFPRRRLLICGLTLFSLASVLGGLATSAVVLESARALQGIAAAVILPTALSLLIAVFPDHTPEGMARRGRALATLGATAAAGGTSGYFLGGALTESLGWQSTFLINVPVVAAIVIFAPRALPAGLPLQGHRRLNLGSAALLSSGIVLLVYAFIGVNGSGWLSMRTLLPASLSVVLLGAFLLVQHAIAQPLIPLGIFRNRAMCGANLVAALINVAIGPVILLLSIYTQQILKYSPLESGIAILPIAATIAISSALTGRLLRLTSQRTILTAGLVLFLIGLLWGSRLAYGPYWAELLGPECLIGLGGGLVFVTFTVAGTSGLQEDATGAASGLLATSQKIGAALGFAMLTGVAGGSPGTGSGGGPVTDASRLLAYRDAIGVAAVPVVLAIVATVIWIPRRADQKVDRIDTEGVLYDRSDQMA